MSNKKKRSKLVRFLMSRNQDHFKNTSERRQIIALMFKVAFLEAMALSLILPSVTSTGEIPTPANDAISFHATAIGNSTANTNLITSTSWIATHNETIVITLTSLTGDVVTSISDLASDRFTKVFHETQGCLPCFVFEIWIGNYFGLSGTTNTITIQWNNVSSTSQDMFLASTYLNVGGVGNATGITGTSNTGSFQIETEKSGSSIVGGMFNTGQAGNNTCPGVIAGPKLTQRIKGCGIREFPGIGFTGDIEDNMTILPNNTFFTYSTSWDNNNHGNTNFDMGAIELISVDQSGSPSFSTFCTNTNGLCITTQYKMNFVKSTQANAINKALALNTAYCTGITTSALTTGSSPIALSLWGGYGGVDLNITGAKILVQVEISTVAPTTTFGVGLCAGSNTIVGTASWNFTTSGSLSSTRAFSQALNGIFVLPTPNTVYYGWIEITAQNFPSGSLGFDQIVNQPYSMSFLMVLEIK